MRNIEATPEQAQAVMSYLEQEGWTEAEFVHACHRIAVDPELARQVGYNGCLTPDVFTLARNGASDSAMTWQEMDAHARRNGLTVVKDYRPVGKDRWIAE